MYFEIFYSYLSRLDEIINYFNEKKKVEIRFRTGIESFDNDFRRNVYKKNILLDEKKIKEFLKKIDDISKIQNEKFHITEKTGKLIYAKDPYNNIEFKEEKEFLKWHLFIIILN